MTQEQLVKLFDHTCLHPYATEADMKKLCDEARAYEDLPLMLSVPEVSEVLEISISTLEDHVAQMSKHELFFVDKHTSNRKYRNTVHTIYSLENPEIYRNRMRWRARNFPFPSHKRSPL